MKLFLVWMIFLLGSYSSIMVAQKNAPKWAIKQNKAVIEIETFDSNGNSHKGYGFFTNPDGEAVSSYSLFQGAKKAIVTDMDGRKMEVTQIQGADELYDVIRFRVAVHKNTTFLSVTNQLPAVGTEAYILPFGFEKGASLVKGAVLEVTPVKEKFGYVKIDAPLDQKYASVPLLTVDGNAFGIAQIDASGNQKTFGISISYINSIEFSPTDVFNPVYSSIGIRKAWPSDFKDAEVALTLYGSRQSPKAFLETLNDFVSVFPEMPEGYLSRATHYAHHRKELAQSEAEEPHMLEKAMNDLHTASKYSDNKAESYFNQAQLISLIVGSDSTLLAKEWSLATATDKLNQALAIDDLPAYRKLEADIAYFQGDFQKAYAGYKQVAQSLVGSSVIYYLAAKALQQTPGANMSEIIQLIDSAVLKSAANPAEALEYLQENVELKMQFGQYEAAIKDYNQCYSLMAGNVSDVFYYYREQAKYRSGDMEGALVDIELALSLSPENSLYYAEKASIYLKQQEPAKAQEQIKKAMDIDADVSAYYRLLGVSFIRQQKKKEACQAFNRAKELGDSVVEKLIIENCQ